MRKRRKNLRNEKINTTDEFLVKKSIKLPPDIDKIPKPGTISETGSKEDSFKKIISKDDKISKVKEKNLILLKSQY